MVQFRITDVRGTRFEHPERYTNLLRIGEGSQGICCSALDTVTGSKVVIKKLFQPFKNETHAKRAFREVKLMRETNHPNIIRFYGAFTPQKSLDKFQDVYIVMEHMDADLSKVIQLSLDHEKISYLIYQILCGLKHLHSADIFHRDLKPTNIVCNTHCRLKILDFGLARSKNGNLDMTPYVVTRYYRSPEVILEMSYGSNVDVWSVGCILGELILGRVVFKGRDHLDQWYKIIDLLGSPPHSFIELLQEGVREFIRSNPRTGVPFEKIFPDHQFPPSSDDYPALNSDNARDLLQKMLIIDPGRRISVDQALNHPYINLWQRPEELNGPPPRSYDSSIETTGLTVAQWKEKLYKEVVEASAQSLVDG